MIVLDEMVVRVPRERQRIEAEGVDARKVEQAEVRIRRGAVWGVEGDEIVAEQEFCALRELVEAVERLGNVAAAMCDGFAGTAANGGKLEDAASVASDLEIDRETT